MIIKINVYSFHIVNIFLNLILLGIVIKYKTNYPRQYCKKTQSGLREKIWMKPSIYEYDSYKIQTA